MPEPDTPTAVSLDAIEHLVETRLLCQALQLGGEILLERLAAPLCPPLQRSVDIGWEITNEHVCHAIILISYWVPGQAVARDEDEQTTTEFARVCDGVWTVDPEVGRDPAAAGGPGHLFGLFSAVAGSPAAAQLRGSSSTTGMTRSVFCWYSANPGYWRACSW